MTYWFINLIIEPGCLVSGEDRATLRYSLLEGVLAFASSSSKGLFFVSSLLDKTSIKNNPAINWVTSRKRLFYELILATFTGSVKAFFVVFQKSEYTGI